MILTRTPFRISFFGGGTDYPVWYEDHGGLVLSTTINKYCYVMVRYLPPFFDHKYRIRYTNREETQEIDGIVHPSVRECLNFLDIKNGIEMVHTSDIPARSGIGSSSAFTVGFLNALHALKGQMTTKRQLATEAIEVEQKILKENVGSQDQVAAAFGGLNIVEFNCDSNFVVTPILIPSEKRQLLERHLMLFFTGISRTANDIALEQINKTTELTNQLTEIKDITTKAIEVLKSSSDDITEFGNLMHSSWHIKRALTDKISSSEIDTIYSKAMAAGAIGGKLLGAGGGGFMLFFVEPELHHKVKEALGEILYVPFSFEYLGSQVTHFSQQDFY